MILIVGLGNPGKKYQNNRHNVGFQFIDYLIENLQIPNPKIQDPNKSQILNLKLYKTDCFMNESGIFVKKQIKNLKLEIRNLVVAHDDLDIPFGKFHIQFGVGPLLHNGLESIENHIHTKDFYRIRIGVDARTPDRKIPGEKYVLSDFTTDEINTCDKDIFPKIYIQLKQFLKTQPQLLP